VAPEVAAELEGAAARAEAAGVARNRIAVDPGLGFAKTAAQNFRLLDELATIVALGYPVAVGRRVSGSWDRPPGGRWRTGTAQPRWRVALAWERGARLFRVHDVALTREALTLASATTNPT